MKKSWLFFWSILLLYSCGDGGNGGNDSQPPTRLYLVATTGMIADALENVVGNKATVKSLMGPGVDPHLFKPTPSDLQDLRKANAIFYNGLHLEGKMQEVLEKLGKQKTVVAVSHSVPEEEVIMVDGNTPDPHIWFDVSMWRNVVLHIGEQMAAIDPIEAMIYRRNAAAYARKLTELHEKVKDQINAVPEESRVLVTAHDAFTYFGRAYEIEVKALQGISTVAEFGLRDISTLVDFITERKIKAVFVESSIPQKSLEAVVEGCREKGHEIKIGGTLYSDAMGKGGTPEGSYLGMVDANISTIVNALK